MSRDTRITLAAFCLLGLLLILHALLFFPMRVDDSFILLRYAENLARGLGPVFNPGERVEGFTSPAMVGLEALLLRLGMEPFVPVKLLGMAWGLVLLGSTQALTRELSGSRAAAVVAGLLVALHPSVAVACINNLETAPFAALVTLGLWLHVRARSARDEGLAGLALALAILFRLEGALPLAFIGMSSLVRWRHEPDRWRRWGALALPALVLVVPFQALKALWFGSLVPNTLLAKVPRDPTGRLASGLEYITRYGREQQGYLALPLVWWLAFKGDARFRLLAALATAWGAYIAWVGGDWIPHFRFLVPLVPIACTALATALLWLWTRLGGLAARTRTLVRGGLVLLLLATFLPPTVLQEQDLLLVVQDMTFGSLRAREQLGPWLSARGGAGSSVALVDVGAVAYHSDLHVIDTGGLTDARVARIMYESHGSYRGHLYYPDKAASEQLAQRVLAERPRFVVLVFNGDLPWLLGQTSSPDGAPPPFIAATPQDGAFVDVPDFAAQYQYLCSFAGDPAVQRWVWHYNVFARKELSLTPARTNARGHTPCL